MLFSNLLKRGSPNRTTRKFHQRATAAAETMPDPRLEEAFINFPLAQQVGSDDSVPSDSGSISNPIGAIWFEADVCDRESGNRLGRIRVFENRISRPFHTFELLDGHFKQAWATSSRVLIRTSDEADRLGRLTAYPADGCTTGLISLIDLPNS